MKGFFLGVLVAVGLVGFAAYANPPVGDRLVGVIEAALSGDPIKKSGTGLGTTIDDAIDTDLNPNQQNDSVSQLFVVTNLDTANYVCIGSVAWTVSGTGCLDKLDTNANWDTGSVMTCTLGSAHIGSLVPPGQSRSFRYDGTRCVGIVASAASTDYVVERYVR